MNNRYPTESAARGVSEPRFGFAIIVFAIMVMCGFIRNAIFSESPGTTGAIDSATVPSLSLRSNLLTQITTNQARLPEFEPQLDAIDTELNGYKAQMDAILEYTVLISHEVADSGIQEIENAIASGAPKLILPMSLQVLYHMVRTNIVTGDKERLNTFIQKAIPREKWRNLGAYKESGTVACPHKLYHFAS